MDDEEKNFVDLKDSDFPSNFSKTKNNQIPSKKYIIIGAISIAILLIIILIIILVATGSDNSGKSKKREELGYINCIYDIDTINKEVKILGDNFQKLNDFDIYINGEKIDYSNYYNFKNIGSNNIQFKLYEDINMDNMFNNVSSLLSAEMIAAKKIKILSMISTFENCKNMELFNISGF